jgi:hypothetical protein
MRMMGLATMRTTGLATRKVLVLGRRPAVRWDDLRIGLRKGDELVIVSLGYPVTKAQRDALFRAEGLAERAGAWFDALLVTSTNEMSATVRAGDDVQVAARGFEGRRLRAALGIGQTRPA